MSAIGDEIKSLEDHNTWEIVPVTSDIKPIRCGWVFRKKIEDGRTRYKARLVAKGYTQKPGIDYFETSSPVIDISSVRLLLSFAQCHDMIVHHIDVKTAYLNAELKENIFMRPPRFSRCYDDPKVVCRLQKSIYGLKQSAKCWYDQLRSILSSSFSLHSLVNNGCIFTDVSRSIIIGVYVDDLLILAKSIAVVDEFKTKFSKIIAISDKGPVSEFLGLEIQMSSNHLYISQSQSINRLIDTHGLRDANIARTPLSPGSSLDGELEKSPLLPEQNSYLSIVGSLLHLSNFSRPDISFAVGQLCRFSSSPTQAHLTAAKRVIRYLKHTINFKLSFIKSDCNFIIYTDADFGNGSDTKSTTGILAFHGSNLIDWSSQKQRLVSLSTMEAEVNAIRDASVLAIYFQNLLFELKPNCSLPPVSLFNDNQSACVTVNSSNHAQRSKHYLIRVNFIRECISSNYLTVQHLPSVDMLADALTKSLTEQKLHELMSRSRFLPVEGEC
jgi:hypothetical protein